MKKLLVLFMISTGTCYAGLVPITRSHNDKTSVDREFTNGFMNAQPKQFTIFKATPTINQLQDGQIVLVSSTNVGIAWRDGNRINFLTSSGALSVTTFITNNFSSTTIYLATTGVTKILPGQNVELSPTSGIGDVTIGAISTGTTRIIAGTNVTISPTNGLGDVTINSSGGGGTISNGWNSGYLWKINSDGEFEPSLVTFANDQHFDYDVQGNIMPKTQPNFAYDGDGNLQELK